MEIQEIDFFIASDGTVKMEVRGVKGRKCLALTDDIEKILGGAAVSREMTPEYDENAEEAVKETSTVDTGW